MERESETWRREFEHKAETARKEAEEAATTLQRLEQSLKEAVTSAELDTVAKAALEPALQRVVAAATAEMDRLGHKLADSSRAVITERMQDTARAQTELVNRVEEHIRRLAEVRWLRSWYCSAGC